MERFVVRTPAHAPPASRKRPCAPSDDAAADGDGAGTCAGVREDSRAPPCKLRARRRVVLVRHGESTFNVRPTMAAVGAPDAPLTPKGWQQARAAGAALAKLGCDPFARNVRWISSPMSRALQTLSAALQTFEAPDAGAAGAASDTGAAGTAHRRSAPSIEVRAEATEHLATVGDVPRPASSLKDLFKHLLGDGGFASDSFAQLAEHWWPHAGHNSCETAAGRADAQIRKREKLDEAKLRAHRLLRYVRSRNEDVVLIGHSTLFHLLVQLAGGAKAVGAPERRLRNGEVVVISLL